MRTLSKVLVLLLSLSALGLGDESKVYQPPDYKITIPKEVELDPTSQVFPLPESDLVNLDEAIDLALSAHENLIEAQAAVDQALARAAQNRSAYFPQIGASATYTKPLYFNVALPAGISGAGVDSGALAFFTNAPEGPSEQVQINQLLYDFNRTRSAVKAAKARTKASRHQLEATRHQLIFDVSRAYLELLRAQSLAEVALLTAENQALHIEEARKLHATGLGLPIDVVRAQTAYANAVQTFTQNRNQALTARVRLAALMGLDPRTPYAVEEPGAPKPLARELSQLVDQALGKRPTLLQSKALVTAQEYQVQNAKAGNKPRLTSTLGFTANQVSPQPQSENLSIMFNLEIPLFDGGLTKAQTAEARAGLTSAQAQLSRLERQVVEEVTTAYIARLTAQQKLTAVDIEVAGAKESVRVATGRYRLGLGRFIEVLDAEQALASARINQVNARTEMSEAHASLKLAIGDPVVSKTLEPGTRDQEPRSLEPPSE